MGSMLLYFTPLLLSIAAFLVRSRLLEVIAILIAGLILLVRDGVGYDYNNYVRIFEEDVSYFFSPLADLLQDLARVLAVPNGFMGLAVILTTGLLLYLSRTSTSPRLSILVFLAFPLFFLETFTIVRQELAVMFVVLSYQLVRNKYTVRSIIPYLIATSIHPSAAISLPLFFIIKFRLSWRYLLIVPPIFGLLFFISNIYLSSDLSRFYQQEEVSGNYYLIVTGSALVVAMFLKQRDLVIFAILGLSIALTMFLLSNYVLNRLLVFIYVPFLFVPLSVRGGRALIASLAVVVVFCTLFFAAFSVKLRDPENGFIPYDTIF